MLLFLFVSITQLDITCHLQEEANSPYGLVLPSLMVLAETQGFPSSELPLHRFPQAFARSHPMVVQSQGRKLNFRQMTVAKLKANIQQIQLPVTVERHIEMKEILVGMRIVKYNQLAEAVPLYLELLSHETSWLRFAAWSQIRFLALDDFSYQYQNTNNGQAIAEIKKWIAAQGKGFQKTPEVYLDRYVPCPQLMETRQFSDSDGFDLIGWDLKDYKANESLGASMVPPCAIDGDQSLIERNRIFFIEIDGQPIRKLRYSHSRFLWELIDPYLAGSKDSPVVIETKSGARFSVQRTHKLTLKDVIGSIQ